MYLYTYNYSKDEKEMCIMEQKYLFGLSIDKKYFFHEEYIDVDRSPFVRFLIDIKFIGNSLGEIVDLIHNNKIVYNNFKVYYVNVDGKMEFNEKHKIEGIIGMAVNGEPKIHDPDIILGISVVEGKWVFGEYRKNKNVFTSNMEKPYQYCNALTSKLSRAVVNIAVAGTKDCKMVDPCCGIGTVVVEALSMGIKIKGYDINPNIVYRSKKNLEFLGYENVIYVSDIAHLNEVYDACVVDLPYGILSITDKEIQTNIIRNARRITKRMVLISAYDITNEIKECGFDVIDMCEFRKSKFIRFIILCE